MVLMKARVLEFHKDRTQRMFDRIEFDCMAVGGRVERKVEKDGTHSLTCILREPRELTVSIHPLVFYRVVRFSGLIPKEPYMFSKNTVEEVAIHAEGCDYAEISNVFTKTYEPSSGMEFEIKGKFRGFRIRYNPKNKKMEIDLLKELG